MARITKAAVPTPMPAICAAVRVDLFARPTAEAKHTPGQLHTRSSKVWPLVSVIWHREFAGAVTLLHSFAVDTANCQSNIQDMTLNNLLGLYTLHAPWRKKHQYLGSASIRVISITSNSDTNGIEGFLSMPSIQPCWSSSSWNKKSSIHYKR